jgi:filamentous hemagglutinin
MMINPEILIPRQGRSEMSSSQIKRLHKSMQKTGFDATYPIEIAEIDGKLIILDGHHRTAAAIKAKIKQVPITQLKVTVEHGHQLLQQAAEAKWRDG